MNTEFFDERPTDISDWPVEAKCVNCGKIVIVIRESAWTDDDGKLWTDCMCSEGEQP